MTSAFNTTRIARILIALGLTLAAVTQLWATDWPPNPSTTQNSHFECKKDPNGYGGAGICCGQPQTCSSNVSNGCTWVPYAQLVDFKYYGLCVTFFNHTCFSFNEYWACAYVLYSYHPECNAWDECDLMVSVGPNVCDWDYHYAHIE